jgi:hypothetical protein
MKRKIAPIGIVLLGSLAAVACAGGVIVRGPVTHGPSSGVPAGASAEVELFFHDLTPYGSWVRLQGPGWVWYPRNVPVDWRPYLLGRWVYSDFGWTWVSDEDWGWAVYHYGRWHYDPSYGWVWVPGSEWGPAWVTWHSGGGWIGWAPLPWQVKWRAGIGLDWGNVNVRVALDPTWWCFVRTRHLMESSPGLYIAPAARNVTLINITKNVTNYTIVDNRVFNQGVKVNVVSKAVGRPVRQVRVKQADSPQAARGDRLEGEELVVFRPGLHRGRQPAGTPGHAKQSDPEAAGTPAGRARSAPARGRDHSTTNPEGSGSYRPADPRRHEKRARELESHQARERDRLEQSHSQESGSPPPGVSNDDINQRHDAEHRALEAKQERERRLLEQRQKREQGSKPQASRPPAKESKPGASKSKSSKPESEDSEKADESESDKDKP